MRNLAIISAIVFSGLLLVTPIVEAGSNDRGSGWAWSDTIGWISFNSTDCDPDGDGFADGDPAGCPGSPVAPTSGLAAYWALDDGTGSSVATDSAGTDDGTLQNMDAASDWVAGNIGAALDFDGVDDYVEVADSPSFSMADFTVSYWVNPTAYNPSDQSEVVTKWGSSRHFLLGFQTDGDYYFALGDSSCSGTNAVVTFQNTAPPLGQWTHVAWVQDGTTGQMTLYENGVPKASTTYSPNICQDSITPLRIGARGDNQEFFNGAVDEVRVYNRVLSQEEVGDLYGYTGSGPVAVEDYGVTVDLNNGNLSGYAWADTIGWIDFAPAGPYPDGNMPNYAACLDRPSVSGENCDGAGDDTISGWARVLSGDPATEWGSWIKLTEVTWDPNTFELAGWAWGDEVVGWISFNDSTVILDTNSAPDPPSNLQDDEATLGNTYCFKVSPPVVVSWDYSDPDDNPPGTDPQSAYQVQIDQDPAFGSVDIDSGKLTTASEQYAPAGLLYNTTYYWRVRVWDSPPNEKVSVWAVAPSPFTTDDHAWPNPSNFTWTPLFPEENETVQFDDGDPFDPAATGPFSWAWDFESDGTVDETIADPMHSFSPIQQYGIELVATDEVGSCTAQKPLQVTHSIPEWKEGSPYD